MSKAAKQKAYAAAGVDIELGNRIKKGLHEKVRTTFGPEVLGTDRRIRRAVQGGLQGTEGTDSRLEYRRRRYQA